MFKKGWNSIQGGDRPGRPTMASTPEMVDSVNMLILPDRRISIENISKQLGISVDTAHKILPDDLAFSKVICHWVLPVQWKAS